MMRHPNRCRLHWSLFASILLVACSGSSSNTTKSATTSGQPAPAAVSQETHAAAFVEQTVPAQMAADGEYTVSVRMRNTGKMAWSAADSYRIGSVNPLDNEVWGLRRVAVPAVIAPGSEVTFTFALKAPQMPGEYNFQWRMVQDGVEWFGDPTPNVAVAVVAPAKAGQ